MSADTKINSNADATDSNTELAKAVDKFEEFLANIAVEAIEVGNVRPIHPERMQQAQAMIDNKKKQDAARFRNFLKQIENQIARLQGELDDLYEEKRNLEEEKAKNNNELTDIDEQLEKLEAQGKGESPEAKRLRERQRELDGRNKDIDIRLIVVDRDITDKERELEEVKDKYVAAGGSLEDLKKVSASVDSETVALAGSDVSGVQAKINMDASLGLEGEDLTLTTSGRAENDIAAQAGEDSVGKEAKGDSVFSSLISGTTTNLAPTKPSNIIAADFNARAAPVIMENIDLGVTVANIDVQDVSAFTLGSSDQNLSQNIAVQTLG